MLLVRGASRQAEGLERIVDAGSAGRGDVAPGQVFAYGSRIDGGGDRHSPLVMWIQSDIHALIVRAVRYPITPLYCGVIERGLALLASFGPAAQVCVLDDA